MLNACRIVSRLCSRLACDTITPFGEPVEPDVYCRKARSCPTSGRGEHVPVIPAATLTTGSGRPRIAKDGRDAPTLAVVSTQIASASSMMRSMRSAPRFRRGGYAGTATTPAYRQPTKARRKSMPGGKSRRARSPGAAWRVRCAAIARASRSSSAYVHQSDSTSPCSRKVIHRLSGVCRTCCKNVSTSVATSRGLLMRRRREKTYRS